MNWQTTLSGITAALSAAVTVLAALPYQLGPIAETIPPEWKASIVKIGLVAMVVSKIWNGIAAADASSKKDTTKRLSILFAIALPLVFLTGCLAMNPRIHFDTDGYEVGVSGSWTAVVDSLSSMWRKQNGLPDFTLASPDADTLGDK